MNNGEKRIIPLTEGLYTLPASPDEKPHLIGSRCINCNELYFPKKEKGLCIHCQQKTLEEVELSRQGKIASFTIVLQPPAGGFYHGPVPYAYGYVDLPEGVRVETQFTGNFNNLEIDGDVEMVIEKLYENAEGDEFVTYKFKPLKEQK
ncbi:MAG TPA: hypothetical protein DCK87_07685 [Desulfotomaculum sp.]|nr:hypothetical protein [Desulfotomaculum sp.]